MNNTLPQSGRARGVRPGGFSALAAGLRHGLQWRLLLAWTALMLLPTLLLALPVTGWLHAQFGHSVQAGAIAAGNELPLLAEALLSIGEHGAWLGGSALAATLLALLLAPWLAGMVIASIRTGFTLRIGALLGDFDHLAAYLQIAIRIVGIANRQRNAGIAAHIAILLAALRGIDNDMSAVVFTPHRRYLRTAIRH